MGCEHPSPVQLKTIPAATAGSDVIVQAKSGTGKTIAFCAVVLESIDASRSDATQAMILAPTREIAMQVADELSRLSWYFVPAVSVALFIGGVAVEEDEARIQQGLPHVAVGTPGRTLKLLREGQLATDLRVLVLDEADKLLDVKFRHDITAITELAWGPRLQFLALSATFPPPLIDAAEQLFVHVEKQRSTGGPVMRDLPQKVMLCTSAVKKGRDGRALAAGDRDALGTDEVLESAVLKGVVHFRYVVRGYHVRQKVPALLEILTTAAYQQAFVFCRDTDSAVQIAEMVSQAGVPAVASSGRMEQAWRTAAFTGLKRCEYRVLVCTDLLARGVDVDNVDVVVNLDLPTEKETYLHRVGRTARFGSIGWSVSLVFEGDEDEHLRYFQMQLGFGLAEYADRDTTLAAHAEQLGVADPLRDQGAQLQPPAVAANRAPVAPGFLNLAALEAGSPLQVLDDAGAVLQACRDAGVGTENDNQRVMALGQVVTVLQTDPSDDTVKCAVPSIGSVWFPLAALAPAADACGGGGAKAAAERQEAP
ncbi:unnamed protein product, partial [Prorocentrum cordatum]